MKTNQAIKQNLCVESKKKFKAVNHPNMKNYPSVNLREKVHFTRCSHLFKAIFVEKSQLGAGNSLSYWKSTLQDVQDFS